MKYQEYYDVLKQSKLFAGLSSEEMEMALDHMNAKIRSYAKGELILRFGEEVKYAIMVLEGEARGTLYEPVERPMDVIHVKEGEILLLPGSIIDGFVNRGEQEAITKATVLFMDMRSILEEIGNSDIWCNKLTYNIITLLAEHSVRLNKRLGMIAHKEIRDRVMLYLNTLPVQDGGVRKLPMNMTALARFLHVDKSAMYKNIKEMQEEGVLEWDGREIKIL